MDAKTTKRKPERHCQTCVDFESPLAIGTKYGKRAGNKDGDVVFTTNKIPVSVYNFSHPSSTSFGDAAIANPPAPFGVNQVIKISNINLGFDFSKLGFLPTEVQFEFLDQGGHQNLGVNGSPLFIGRLASAPTAIAGVSITVFTTAIQGGCKGVVILRGTVKELVVGGQEFWLDQVCVK